MRTALLLLTAGLVCSTTSSVQAQSSLPRLEAREVWRVDGTESGDPFGDLRDYVVLRDGSLWMLDWKDQVIRRYAVDGRPLGTVGRKGSGPGEMANANGLAVSPAGTVWANDPRNARINVYSADGKFERQIARYAGGYAYRWGAWFHEATGVLYEHTIGGGSRRWRQITLKGDTAGTVADTECPDGQPSAGGFKAESKNGNMYGSYPFSIGGGVAPVGNGTAWCASSRASRVALVRVGTNDTVLRTTVDVPVVPVGKAERDEMISATEERVARYTTTDFDKSKVPTSKPGIAGVHVDEDGRLWVQHASRSGVSSTTFDLHDAKGQHLGRLTLPVRNVGHLPLRARGNLVWLTMLDEDDVPSIVQFQLVR